VINVVRCGVQIYEKMAGFHVDIGGVQTVATGGNDVGNFMKKIRGVTVN
jgi:hypothetical protein